MSAEQSKQISELEGHQASMLMDFAKKNYSKIMSSDGKQIKINGAFYDITKIVEEVEDHYAELTKNFNAALITQDSKQIRTTLYALLTFATSATESDLKNCDRGELRAIALVLGLIQQGFRDL